MRVMVGLFVMAIVLLASNIGSYLLAAAGVLIGMLFMIVVRSGMEMEVDEREKMVAEKAARLTYAIFGPTIGLGSFLMLFPSGSGWKVFSKGDFVYLESLGMVLAYLTFFLIIVYVLAYLYLNRKYGGGNEK